VFKGVLVEELVDLMYDMWELDFLLPFEEMKIGGLE
jgi:hypothetical protein